MLGRIRFVAGRSSFMLGRISFVAGRISFVAGKRGAVEITILRGVRLKQSEVLVDFSGQAEICRRRKSSLTRRGCISAAAYGRVATLRSVTAFPA